MLKVFTILFLSLLVCKSKELEIQKDFLITLNKVETGGKTGMVVGKNGEIGPFQIKKAYWQDAKRHGGLDGEYVNCTNWDYSIKVITIYLNYYAPNAIKNKNYEILARIHNGGPSGFRKKTTIPYWKKFQKYYASKKD